MSEFTADELEAPSWMNDEFFKQVLTTAESDDSISITDVRITPATTKGEHFASVMFRGTIEYDTLSSKGITKSLIIKTMPEMEGYKLDFLADSYIFETEIGMYYEVIPKLEAELRKIGDETVLGAKALYSSLEPRKVIIFEDIVPKGYATLRDRLANMEEAKAAFLKLAKWHAASYKLAAEGDQTVTKYRESLLNMKSFTEDPFTTMGMDNFIEKLESTEDLKMYVPKLRKVQRDLLERCIASSNLYRQKGGEGIFALCHGDFHAKNMMFKRSDHGVLGDVILVDFQLSFYGPAIMDIIYGIYMVLSEDLRKNHRDEIVYYYSSNFLETLERLKFKGDVPKISDFFIELLRHKDWEIFLLSTFLPIWYAVSEHELDENDLMTSNDARKTAYDNKAYINEVRRRLPIMLHQGYLD